MNPETPLSKLRPGAAFSLTANGWAYIKTSAIPNAFNIAVVRLSSGNIASMHKDMKVYPLELEVKSK